MKSPRYDLYWHIPHSAFFRLLRSQNSLDLHIYMA